MFNFGDSSSGGSDGFNFGDSSSKSSDTGFNFGGDSSSSGFNFGGDSSSSGFNFGGDSSSGGGSSSGGFNFGEEKKDSGGFNFGSDSSSGFNFGGSDQSSSSFDFSLGGDDSTSGFSLSNDGFGMGVNKKQKKFLTYLYKLKVHKQLVESIISFIAKYQRGSPLCVFNYWMFTKTNPQRTLFERKKNLLLYSKVLPQSRFKDVIEKVMRNNPDPKVYVPVLVRSFDQMYGRIVQQKERIKRYNEILDNIRHSVRKYQREHDVLVRGKIDRVRLRYRIISGRLVTVLKKIEVYRQRGRGYSYEDRKMKEAFLDIQYELNKPTKFKKKVIQLVPKVKQHTSTVHQKSGFRMNRLTKAEREGIANFLKNQTEGIHKLCNVIKKDMRDFYVIKNIISQEGGEML